MRGGSNGLRSLTRDSVSRTRLCCTIRDGVESLVNVKKMMQIPLWLSAGAAQRVWGKKRTYGFNTRSHVQKLVVPCSVTVSVRMSNTPMVVWQPPSKIELSRFSEKYLQIHYFIF